MYYIYMLRCEDNSLYTGITTDVEKRINEHFSGGKKCAKYTRSHKPKKLESVWQTETKTLASKLEYHIKTLKKEEKEELIKKNNLKEYLENKIECDLYQKKD